MTISKNKVTARAYTNIALIKYWGKVDQKLKIPTTSSLSLTLKDFYTDTSVLFSPVPVIVLLVAASAYGGLI